MQKIGFFYGGRSTEHIASVSTFDGVIQNINKNDTAKFEVIDVIFIQKNGEILLNNAKITKGNLIDHLTKSRDVFYFNLLHGNEGEDGSWSGVADICDIVGSFESVNTSAILMNKYQQNCLILAENGENLGNIANLQIPKTHEIKNNDSENLRNILRIFETFPKCDSVIIKPNNLGSSVLTERFLPNEHAKIADLVAKILKYDSSALIQNFVNGKEYTCGTYRKNGVAMALPPLLIETDNFSDYESKHNGSRRTRIDSSQTQLQKISAKLMDIFNIVGICRFDFMVDNGTTYYLEGNLVPALRPQASYPKMMVAAGLSYDELLSTMINSFLERKVIIKEF
ncbi:MAG: hypothetical protein FWG64_10695 [Firmicutes bacterium]|nr:hypothetical protein [Bacillota bacterium]